MAESYNHLADDTYINARLSVTMDLALTREPVMSLFERVKRDQPAMARFRKTKSELALESDLVDGQQYWLGLRRRSVRSGLLNPAKLDAAYKYHKLVLDTAPLYLTISPLDVTSLEVVFGFNLMATGNHDAIVFDALVAGSPLASMLSVKGATPSDVQPVFGLNLSPGGEVQAMFEVRTKPPLPGDGEPHPAMDADMPSPISVLLFVRKVGAPDDIKDLGNTLKMLMKVGDDLVAHRVAPFVLKPLREVIASSR